MPVPNKIWDIITSRVFIAVAIIAVVATLVGVAKGIARRVEVEREISALQRDINSLQTKNEELRNLINYFDSNEYKEREARLKMGLQKPGENVVVIPGLADNPGAPPNAEPAPEVSNWNLWWKYFFSS